MQSIKQSTYTKRDPKAGVTSCPWANELAATLVTRNKLQSVSAKGQSIIDSATGEISRLQAVQATRKVIDKTEFVKVYSNGIAAMFDLKLSAQKLFRVIMDMYLSQKHTPDTLIINEFSLAEFGYEYSRTTRSGALNQLIAAEFIAPHSAQHGLFFINPNMFYKGDRMTIINEYAVSGTQAGSHLEEKIEKAGHEVRQLRLIS